MEIRMLSVIDKLLEFIWGMEKEKYFTSAYSNKFVIFYFMYIIKVPFF